MSELVLKRVLIVFCLLQLGGLLVVGLWPLTPHRKNDVSWIKDSDGLQFGEYGSIVSAGEITWPSYAESDPLTLEIWLQHGDLNDSNTFLAFYNNGATRFSLRQLNRDLAVQRGVIRMAQQKAPYIDIDSAFRSNEPALITITSVPGDFRIYLNGKLVKQSSSFPVSRPDVSGTMVVANDPLQNDSWSGLLKGVALYPRELSSGQVKQHYLAWSRKNRDVLKENNPVAIYTFSERKGNVVRNETGTAPNLEIPPYYFILHQALLVPVWREFQNTWGYWKDALINTGGFIPWGLFLCAYLSHVHTPGRALSWTILAGFLVSLFIESVQSFLPTRDSSMSDVMFNSLGTILGAFIAYRVIPLSMVVSMLNKKRTPAIIR